jgi:hypothetical protein
MIAGARRSTAARVYRPLDAFEVSSLTDRGKALAAQWGELRGPVT